MEQFFGRCQIPFAKLANDSELLVLEGLHIKKQHPFPKSLKKKDCQRHGLPKLPPAGHPWPLQVSPHKAFGVSVRFWTMSPTGHAMGAWATCCWMPSGVKDLQLWRPSLMDLHGWDGMGQDETTVVLFREKPRGWLFSTELWLWHIMAMGRRVFYRSSLVISETGPFGGALNSWIRLLVGVFFCADMWHGVDEENPYR